MKHKLLYTAFFILLLQNSFSQTVSLDPTFGTGGEVINNSITSGQAIQLQSDGKIVSCYLSSYSTSGNIHLTRLNSDGSIDAAFGVNGFVNTILFSEVGGLNMMKMQSDGKIVITGDLYSSGNGGYNFATTRLNSDGTIDTTFGVSGYAITDFGTFNGDFSNTIEIQNDGKILVGGYTNQTNLDVALVRYLSNGTVDTTFGISGKFTYNFGTNTIPLHGGISNDEVIAIRVNSLGKIILGIYTDVNESSVDYANFGFVCLNANGTLDASFGSNGQTIVDFGDKDYIANLTLTADDKIIATGRHQYAVGANNYNNIPLVKLLQNGNYDTSFGNNGIVLTNRDSSNLTDISNDLYIQSDGKIICFGATPDPTNSRANFLLIRFNTDGTIDSSFNNVGYKSVDFNTSNAIGTSFLIQNDDKILCAGSVNNYSAGCLARLQMDNLATNTLTNKSFSIYPNPFSESITI